MKISLKRKHALFLLGLVVLQTCLCPVIAARRSRSRRSKEKEDENMLAVISGSIFEFMTVLARMFFSPLKWQSELCAAIWEQRNQRNTPKPEKFSIMNLVKQVLINNMGDIILIVQSIFETPGSWKKDYCMKVVELEKEKKGKGEKQ